MMDNFTPAFPPINMPSISDQLKSPNVIDAPIADNAKDFTFEPVEELFNTPLNSPDVLQIDQNYLDMLNKASSVINKFNYGPTGSNSQGRPSSATNTYDPLAQQGGIDLTTRDGRLRAFKNPGLIMANAPGKPKEPVINNPIFSSMRGTNFDRYYNHPKFAELGWHPYANNEAYYNANSDTFDDMSRMWGQFGSLAGTGFLSSYRSMADFFDGDNYLKSPDIESATEFSDAMRIGNSSKTGVGAFANNFLLNSAYTVGIIGSIAAEEAALFLGTALTGAAGAALVSQTGVNAVKGGRAVLNLFDIGKMMNASRNLANALNKIETARDFWNVTKTGGKFAADFFAPETMAALRSLKTTQTAAQNLTNIAKVGSVFGGFYRDVRSVNLALSESKLEAGMVYNEHIADSLALIAKKNDGAPLTDKDFEEANSYASKAAFKTLQFNAPLIWMTNKIVLGTALGGMNKSFRRIFNEDMSEFGKRVIRTKPIIDKITGKISKDVFEDVGEGALGGLLPSMKAIKGYTMAGTMKAGAHGTLRYFAANLAEGGQELYQDMVSHGTKDYFYGLQNDPSAAAMDVLEQSIASAVGSQMSSQGFETFMSGFLMGGLVQGPQKLLFQGMPNVINKVFNAEKTQEYKANKTAYINELVKSYNESWNMQADDPSALFDPAKLNFLVQKQVAEEMRESAYDGDTFGFRDAQDLGKFQQMYTIFSNGTSELFKDQLRGMQSLTDEELAQAFPDFAKEAKNGKLRSRIESTIKQIDDTQNSYEESKDKFENPFDRTGYEKGTIEYNEEALKQAAFEHARYLYMFTQDGFKKAVERAESIYSTLASDPIINKLAANDLTVLLDVDSIVNELSILSNEMAALGTTPEEKKIKAHKLDRFTKLSAIKNIISDKLNQTKTGAFNKTKASLLYKPFLQYIQHLADTKETFVDKDRILDVLKMIVDHGELKERTRVYDKAIEFLNNPQKFADIVDRTTAIFGQLFKQNKANFEKRVKAHVKSEEMNTLLNKLVELGVYPNADQTVKFLKTGDVEYLQTFLTPDGPVIGKDSLVYLQIEALKRNYIKATTIEEEETPESTESSQPVNTKDAPTAPSDSDMPDLDIDAIDFNMAPGMRDDTKKQTPEHTEPPSEDTTKTIIKQGAGVNVLRTITVNSEDKRVTTYKLVDASGKPISQDLLESAGLTSAIFGNEVSALKAWEKITKLVPDTDSFVFDGITLNKGAIVANRKGEEFIVLATPALISMYGNLHLLPIEHKNLKDKTEIRKVSVKLGEGEFVSEYEVVQLGAGDIKVGKNAERIYASDFISSFPYQNKSANEPRSVAQQRLDVILTNLTPEEFKNLQLVITKNAAAGHENTDRKPIGKDSEPNPYLRHLHEPYSIGLRISDPAVNTRINRILEEEKIKPSNSEDGIFAFLPNNSFQILDSNGNPVDISTIGKDDAKNVFRGAGGVVSLIDIRNNYAKQQVLIHQIKEKLGDKNRVVINADEFSGIKFSPYGLVLNYSSSQEERAIPFDELAYTSANDKGDMLIISNTKKLTKRGTQHYRTYISNLKGEARTKLAEEIEDQLESQGLLEQSRTFGRYVAVIKQPNGILTLAQLKQTHISDEALTRNIQKLIDRAIHTINTNLNPYDVFFDATPKELSFNLTWNNDFNDEFYLAALPGIYVTMDVTAWGKIQMTYYDKNTNVEIGKFPLEQEQILKLQTEPDKLLQLFIDGINSDPVIVKAKIKLSRESFKESFSSQASIEEVLAKTKTSLDNRVRYNLGVHYNVDSAQSQAIKTIESTIFPEEEKPPFEPDPQVNIKPELTAIVAEIAGLDSKLEIRKKEIENSLPKGATREYNQLITNDPIIADIKKRRAIAMSKQRQLAFKIVPEEPLTKQDVEDIEKFTNWVSDNLPDFITIKDVKEFKERLRINGVRVGTFALALNSIAGKVNVDGIIYTGVSSPYKYHEAFHGVFRMLLTDEEIEKYLKYADKKLREKHGSNFEKELFKFQQSADAYRIMSRERLLEEFAEEYLADEFDKFKSNPGKYKSEPELKTFFQKLVAWIKRIFGHYSRNELLTLFENIDAGKYKGAGIQNNQFINNLTTGGITTNAYKLIPVESYVGENGLYDYKYLEPEASKMLISSLAAMYLNRMSDKTHNDEDLAILNQTIGDFAALYDPNADHNQRDLDADALINQYHAIIDYKDELIEAVRQELNIYGYKLDMINEELDEEEQAQGLRGINDWDKDQSLIGGFSSLSVALRRYIGTTTVQKEDMFSNAELTPGEKLIVPVDFNDVYNGFLKAVKNTTDPVKILQKLYFFSMRNENTRAVADRMFADIGVTHEQILAGQLPVSLKDATFFMQIIKGFENFRIDYIFVHKDPKTKKTLIYPASKRDAVNAQLDQWSQAFDPLYSKMMNNPRLANTMGLKIAEMQEIILEDNLIEDMSDEKLKIEAEKYAKLFLENTGIRISVPFIEYTIAKDYIQKPTKYQAALVNANSNVETISSDLIQILAEQLSGGENIFLDKDKLGMKSRLRKLAISNAEFDETIGVTVFKNANNDLVYAHQLPTYDLQRVNDFNDPKVLRDLQESSDYYLTNLLLNNPAFQKLSESDKLQVLRISGSKMNPITDNEDTTFTETGGVNTADSGKTYGDFSPKDFILNLIENYVYYYNTSSNENDTVTTKDPQTNDNVETALAPVLMGVIEASNTGDLIGLPVIKTVELDEDNTPSVTADTLDLVVEEINREYKRIQKESSEETQTQDLIEGYNAKDGARLDGRAYKFTKTGVLLESLSRKKEDLTKVKDPMMKDNTRDRVLEGTQSILVMKERTATKSIRMTRPGSAAIVSIGEESFVMSTRGKVAVTTSNINSILSGLGDAVSNAKTAVYSQEVKRGTKSFFVETESLAKFLRGDKEMFVYDVVKGTTLPEGFASKRKKGDVDEVKNYKDKLEEFAKSNPSAPLSEAVKAAGLTMDGFKDFIHNRLLDEYNDFRLTLDEIGAYPKISDTILKGFYNKNEVITPQARLSMHQLNLMEDSPDYNLMQIFFNDWLNTKAINQLLLGDTARTLKDAVDEVKRAKMKNASGYSAYAAVIDTTVGIEHPVDEISLFPFMDPKMNKSFAKTDEGTPEEGDQADAQLYMTTKAARYMTFGFGQLSPAKVKLLKKIDEGETITSDDFFANKDAAFNSLKLVYGDGETFLKMSAIMLTKELTSVQDKNGNWIARENREDLHNLRVKMEAFEEEEWAKGRGTLGISAPVSAVKMLKKNVMSVHDMIRPGANLAASNETVLSAKYMRLQLINPSNKLEITDPTQMKTLITSELDNSTKVILNGKTVTIGEIRALYNKSLRDRIKGKYINRHNLIINFTIDEAMAALGRSITQDMITTELDSFLRYATAGLEASQSSSNLMEFFSTDKLDNQKYDLNNPITINKFEQLFLAYFSKGIMSEKIPGHSLALVSDFGIKVYRRVFSVEKDANGVPLRDSDGHIIPDRSEIIRESVFQSMVNKPTVYSIEQLENRLDDDPVGIVIQDRLRHNVKKYDESGQFTGERYGEMLMPAHHKQVMDLIENSKDYPSAKQMQKEWRQWSSESTWSPKANMHLVRKEIEDFDENRSKMEFAAFMEYPTEIVDGKVKFKDVVYVDYKNHIPDTVGKMFVIRIPSQDNHSAMNAMMVDFLPVFYGSIGVFAREILEISGADFDIDKGYTHIKEWYIENGKFEEYGKERFTTKEENDKQAYKEYVHYVNKNVNKGFYKEALEKFGTSGSGKEKYLMNPSDAIQASTAGFTPDAVDALRVLRLPVLYDDYIAYKKLNGEPYPAPDNNKVLDYKFAMLGNEHMTTVLPGRTIPIAYEPATIKPLQDVWDEIREEFPELAEAVNEDGLDVDNMYGKLRAFSNNKEGARSIGAVVLPNLYLSLLKEYDIPIASHKEKGREMLPQIEFDGHVFKGFGHYEQKNNVITGSYEIKNGKEDISGHRRQYILSALITAMTDNAKERLAAKLGLNKDALSLVATLTALGVPIKTSILLVNNPIIKREYFYAVNKEDKFDAGIYKLISDKLKDITVNFGALDKVSVNDELLGGAILEPSPVFSSRNMLRVLIDKGEYTEQHARRDSAILTQFLNAHRLNSYISKMSGPINLASGFGKSFTELDEHDEKINILGLKLSDLEFKGLKYKEVKVPVDVRKIFTGNTWQAGNYKIYKDFTGTVLPATFLTRTERFRSMYDTILSNMAGKSFIMTAEKRDRISTDLLSFVTIKAYMQYLKRKGSHSMVSLSNEMIYPQAGSAFNINTIIKDLRAKTAGKNNYFLTTFLNNDPANSENNTSGLNVAISNTYLKMSDNQKIKVQNGFAELYADPQTKVDAMHIIHYIMVKDGLQYGYGSILDAVTPFILDTFLRNVSASHTALKTGAAFEGVFGMNEGDLLNEFLDGYLQSNKNNYLLQTIRDIPFYDPNTIDSVVSHKKISKDNVEGDPERLYVFGENAKQLGDIGQLVIRDLPNVGPITFKRGFATTKKNYYTDDEKDEFIEIFDQDVDRLMSDPRPKVFPTSIMSKEDVNLMKTHGPGVYAYLKESLINKFGYDIDKGELLKKNSKTWKAIANEPVRIEKTETGSVLTFDLYNQLMPDPESKSHKNQRAQQIKITTSTVDRIRYNHKKIGKTGFDIDHIETQNGMTAEVSLPLVIRVASGSYGFQSYRFFKLNKIYAVDPIPGNNFVDTIRPMVNANRAEYIEFNTKGSNQQNAIGFMFDTVNFERPDYATVRQYVNSKLDFPGMNYEDIDEDIEAMSNNDAIFDMVLQKEKNQSGTIVADENGYEMMPDIDMESRVIDASKLGGLFSNDAPQTEDAESNVEDVSDLAAKHAIDPSNITALLQLKLADKYPFIAKYWNDADKETKAVLKEQDIEDFFDFVDQCEKLYGGSEKKMLDHIKTCIK